MKLCFRHRWSCCHVVEGLPWMFYLRCRRCGKDKIDYRWFPPADLKLDRER